MEAIHRASWDNVCLSQFGSVATIAGIALKRRFLMKTKAKRCDAKTAQPEQSTVQGAIGPTYAVAGSDLHSNFSKFFQ